jgi:hypothetical protein
MSPPNSPNSNHQHKVANKVVHNGYGSVQVTNFLEHPKTNAVFGNTDKSADNNDFELELSPLPYQESIFGNLDEFTDSDSESSILKEAGKKLKAAPNPHHSTATAYEIPLSLRRPFRIPRRQDLQVITPLAKRNTLAPQETEPLLNRNTTNNANEPIQRIGSDKVSKELGKKTSETDFLIATKQANMEQAYEANVNEASNSFYHSPFLFQEFKLSNETLDIIPELESLRYLILSQHKAFEHHIKDLGTLYLSVTKNLDKKLNSLQHLKNQDKIPRSLRIKCELTTSPDFANDPEFLDIKNKLQQEVKKFIQNGTTLMTTWAERNIKLLKLQRCSTYLKKAVPILDGLTSFYTDSIGTPLWPSAANNRLTLFLFKAFLSCEFLNAGNFINSLELPAEQILLIGSKLILNTDSDESADKAITSLHLEEIDLNNQIDNFLLFETLTSFSQILQSTTSGIWKSYKDMTKKATAGINLSSKMKTLESLNATEATALAIAKATENAEAFQLSTSEANLRIQNLERNARKQEHKTNELSNQLKHNQQKNSKGSHVKESMTSPSQLTPTLNKHKNKTKRPLIDLTLEKNDESSRQSLLKKQKQNQKTTANTHTHYSKPKTIQWKNEEEVKTYHPHHQPMGAFTPQSAPNPFALQEVYNPLTTLGGQLTTNTKFFPQTIPAPPPPHYFMQAPTLLYQNPTAGHNTIPFQANYNHYPNQYYGNQVNSSHIITQATGNIPNPFVNLNTPPNNTQKMNPFGTSQTLRKH